MALSRGDVVTVATPGAYAGKPRPAVVVQSDLFNPTHPSVTICPLTTALVEAPMFRLRVQPSPGNGLQRTSEVMVDKVTTVPCAAVGDPVGVLDSNALRALEAALRLWLAL